MINFDRVRLARSDHEIMMRVVSGSTSTNDPTLAARLVELEAQVVEQQAALNTERERRVAAEAERDRLREAYEALKVQAELAHQTSYGIVTR